MDRVFLYKVPQKVRDALAELETITSDDIYSVINEQVTKDSEIYTMEFVRDLGYRSVTFLAPEYAKLRITREGFVFEVNIGTYTSPQKHLLVYQPFDEVIISILADENVVLGSKLRTFWRKTYRILALRKDRSQKGDTWHINLSRKYHVRARKLVAVSDAMVVSSDVHGDAIQQEFKKMHWQCSSPPILSVAELKELRLL